MSSDDVVTIRDDAKSRDARLQSPVPEQRQPPTAPSDREVDLREAVRTAVALGWQLSQLYASASQEADLGDTEGDQEFVGGHRAEELAGPSATAIREPEIDPHVLPTLDALPPETRMALRLTQVQARVARLRSCFGDHDGGEWPVATLQSLQQQRASLDQVRASVPDVHEKLLRAMTWVDVRVEKAYVLGVNLERYCRLPAVRAGSAPNDLALLKAQVAAEKTQRIHRALRDLNSVLPEYAAEPVTMSLLAWDQVVNVGPSEPGSPRHGWSQALYRQGLRWRSLLTGETSAGELVPLDAIVGSAVGTLWASRRLAMSALRSFAPVLIGILAVVAILVAVALWSSVDFAEKFISVFATLIAGATGAWKAVSPRIAQAFKDHEDEIIGASRNWAIAYEITPPPVRSDLRVCERWDALKDFLGSVRRHGSGSYGRKSPEEHHRVTPGVG